MSEPLNIDDAENVATKNSGAGRSRVKKPRRNASTFVIVLGFLVVAGIGYVAGMGSTGMLGLNLNRIFGSTEDLDLSSLQVTYGELVANFDGEIKQQELIEGAHRGMVEAVGDEYTVFMNKSQTGEFDNSLTGNIGGGIGIEIGVRNNLPTVLRVIKDNPAEKAGVVAGDIIMAVNGETTRDLDSTQIASKIRGEEGTTVKLTVNRAGEEMSFDITRKQVNNPSAYGEVMASENGEVGVMTISRFDGQTGSLARAVASDFKKRGVNRVVLDLRGNGGGYVSAAKDVAGIWLDGQVVVSERRGGKVTEELKTGSNPILNGVPTVVLVNGSSASASEIVAGALRDHKAAKLVGETTFGKGSVQKLINLPEGATLKVTIARWYTPAGVNISETGIKPDVVADRTAKDINEGRDPQLEAAIKAL